ncbi:hypothetical protein ACFE04_013004 [Oxalis oulophora]
MADSYGNRNRRRSRIRVCTSSPLTLHDDDDEDDVMYGGASHDSLLLGQNIPYDRLPEQQLQLSILKLDGSLFDVYVRRSATVAELKQAVEEVFIMSFIQDQEEVSWSHVWGHFCLCYAGQKLINDKACIKSFGIKDGHQLQFIKHLSINNKMSKRQLKNYNVAAKRGFSGSNSHEEKERSIIDDDFEDEGETKSQNRWLSYSKFQGDSRMGSGRKSRLSRFSLQCLIGRKDRMTSLTN